MENVSTAAQQTVRCRGFDPAAARDLAAELGIELFAAKFLVSRGIDSLSAASEYLYPRLSRLHSPFLLDDIVPAVERIRRAIDKKEKTAVFSDSDIDGLTSLAIIRSLLDGAGVPVVSSWPCGEENYGLSLRAVDGFAEAGATLLLTFDCGIRDIPEIAYARSKGIEVIVCDHHEQGPELPDAICVDQKRTGSSYPFRDLAGAGVAMKLCHAVIVSYLPMYGKSFCLISRDGDSVDCRVIRNGIVEAAADGALDERMTALAKESDALCVWNILETDAAFLSAAGLSFEPFDHLLVRGGYEPGKTSPSDVQTALGLPVQIKAAIGSLAQEALFDLGFIRPKKVQSFLHKWLPLSAMGTIADVMPVVGENRTIVACGLKLFPGCDIPAIRLLNEKFAPVNAKSVAWNISPLLNTPGRIGRTELSAALLLSRDAAECETILAEISGLNEDRKDFLREKLSVYTKELSSGADRGAKNFIYIKAPDVTDGYTGLIAGRLADAHGCPAVVVSAVQGKDIFKGSGRAAGGIDFLSHVEPFSTRFERFGGHASAFGFSAKESDIDEIMREVDLSLEGIVLEKAARVADMEIDDTGEITVRALDVLSLCEPFGAGNEPPLFLSRCVPVLRFETFGSGGRHGKFFCGGRSTPAIGWGLAGTMKEYDFTDGADFLYSAEFDQYTKRVRFVIEELL